VTSNLEAFTGADQAHTVSGVLGSADELTLCTVGKPMSDLLGLLGDYFVGKALDTAGAVVRDIVTPTANPFQEIRCRMGGEAAFELTLAFERHVRDQKARDAEFSARLREKVTEREVGALFPSLLRAAAESSTRERMRMLCAALAGIWRPDLDAEMRSRVGRAVLQLEASDVLYLRRLLASETQPGLRPSLPLSREGEWVLRAGCVGDDSVRAGGRGIYITDVGRALLDSLGMWIPEA
jgi:hypothetical protein